MSSAQVVLLNVLIKLRSFLPPARTGDSFTLLLLSSFLGLVFLPSVLAANPTIVSWDRAHRAN